MRFREFMQTDPNQQLGEEKTDIARTLSKIPPEHRKLVQGYKWKFHAGNTLNGDDKHIGYMDDHKKEIAIAGPWNYGREFAILHEIAHRVLEYLCPTEWKQRWSKIVVQTKNKQNQNSEELWCMAYANYFAKNKIVIHNHPEWKKYMNEFCKATSN